MNQAINKQDHQSFRLFSFLGCTAICIASIFVWEFLTAIIISLLLLAIVIPFFAKQRLTAFLAAFFVMLSISDFLKRLVFLIPDQNAWSQYVIWLLPHILYIIFLLLWFLSRPSDVLRSVISQWQVTVFIILALLATWLTPGFSINGRLAATAFLILPWTMTFLASAVPGALLIVCRVLVTVAIISGLYGWWQFVFGPTIIELKWALDTSEFSIGASHLTNTLEGPLAHRAWRIIGLQADTLTFGLLQFNALLSAYILRALGELRLKTFSLISSVILLSIAASIGRSIWVATAIFISLAFLARRVRLLLHPNLVMIMMIGGFILFSLVVPILIGFSPVIQDNPRAIVAFTTQTLSDRTAALETIVKLISEGNIFGIGFAASEWISHKFKSDVTLPPNFGRHNALVELMYYCGAVGVIIFLSILYKAHKNAYSRWRSSIETFIAAYLIALFILGFASGSNFLNYYYFFFLGYLLRQSQELPGMIQTKDSGA